MFSFTFITKTGCFSSTISSVSVFKQFSKKGVKEFINKSPFSTLSSSSSSYINNISKSNNNNNSTIVISTPLLKNQSLSFSFRRNTSPLFNKTKGINNNTTIRSYTTESNSNNKNTIEQQQKEEKEEKEQQIIINNMSDNTKNKSFLEKYLKNTYEYPRFSSKWFMEMSLVMVVFACTGSSALYVVKYLLRNMWQVEGTVFGGPWQYTLAYFTTMFTIYPFVLLSYGTLFGRHQYFKKIFMRMVSFGRLRSLLSKSFSKLSSSQPPKSQ